MSDYADLVYELEYRWGLKEPHFPVPCTITPDFAGLVDWGYAAKRDGFSTEYIYWLLWGAR